MLNILKMSGLFKSNDQVNTTQATTEAVVNNNDLVQQEPVLKVSHLHVARALRTIEDIKSRYPEHFPRSTSAPIERTMADGSVHKFFADHSLLVQDSNGLVVKTRDVRNQIREFRISQNGQTEMCFLGQWKQLSADQKILPDGTFVLETKNKRVHQKLDGTTMTVCLDKGAVMETNPVSKSDIVLYSNGTVLIRRVDEVNIEEQIVLKDSKEVSRSKIFPRNNLINVEIGSYVQRILAGRIDTDVCDGKPVRKTFLASDLELQPVSLKFAQIEVFGKVSKVEIQYNNGEVIAASVAMNDPIDYSFSGQPKVFHAHSSVLKLQKRTKDGAFEAVLTNEESGESVQVGVVQSLETHSGFALPRNARLSSTGEHSAAGNFFS